MTVMSTRSTHSLGTTHCSRGHTHPPWNITGILRIAKCESQCGFCQKETKTAANLRKHVAIHIKNEGLNLTIAEGSSGRGRLEIPPSELERGPSSVTAPRTTSPPNSFSASAVLLSISHPPSQPQSYGLSSYHQQHHPSTSTSSHSTPSPIPGISHLSHPQPYSSFPTTTSPPHHTVQERILTPFQKFYPTPPALTQSRPSYPSTTPSYTHPTFPPNPHAKLTMADPVDHFRSHHFAHSDPFHNLRSHNIATKIAWTAIPSAEGTRILEQCKHASLIDGYEDFYSSSPTTTSRKGSLVMSPTTTTPPHSLPRDSMPSNPFERHERDGVGVGSRGSVPCYNRRVLYDEEWQAHMRDVHGVFLLWPDTWMKRVEVLDLDPFGGDIGVCNDVIMDT